MKTDGKGEAFSGTGSFVYHIVVRDSRIFSNTGRIEPFGIFLNHPKDFVNLEVLVSFILT